MIICGITFSNDKEIAYKDNITNKIVKLERQLDIWRSRQLSLEGKILIVKTYGISQLVYSMQSTIVKKVDLTKIEDIIFRFVWNIKKSNKLSCGKINRKVMKAGLDKGGLNAPDIEIINKAIKYKHLLRHSLDESTHPLTKLYKSKLKKHNFSFSNHYSNGGMGGFLGMGVQVHKELGNRIINNIKLICHDDGIHRNYHSFVQNLSLINSNFTNVNQTNMLHRLMIHNITNLYELYKEKTNPRFPQLALDVQLIFHSFPNEIRTLISRQVRNHILIKDEVEIELNKWSNIRFIDTKSIKNLLAQSNVVPNAIQKVVDKHNIRSDEQYLNPFLTLRKGIKNVRIRSIQFKLLHNIYPTMKHLFTWKIKQTPDCGACGAIESIEHAVYRCEIASKTFRNLAQVLCVDMPSYETVLLGASSTRQYVNRLNKLENFSLDYILIAIKQRLILQRENKIELSQEDIKGILRSVSQLEKYNAIKLNSLEKFTSKWKWIESVLDI